MAAAEVTSARQEVQTADEAVHLVSGYSILRQSRFSLNAENPPAGKMWSAIPLVWLNPDLPRESGDSWQDENSVTISAPFLYRNRLPADEILFWGRMPTMLLSLAFGAALAVWTRFRFGARAALIALALYCFDPNFIAHGRYVTSDIYGACFFFLGAVTWCEFLLRRRLRWAVAASLFTAVGICSKFNLLLLPVAVVVSTILHRNARRPLPLRALALYFALIPPVIWACYGFELRIVDSDRPVARFLSLNSTDLARTATLPTPAAALLNPAGSPGKAIHWAAAHVPIPAYSFLKGLYRLYNHSYWGHPAYLLGRVSTQGWWWYFPLALLVKTPTGTLLLLILAAALGRRIWNSAYPIYFLVMPAALYFAVAMAGRIDIGLRHILPVYPFFFVFIGATVATFRGRTLAFAAAALVLVAVESASIYPNYLAFFNLPSGGAPNGPTYLVDSNLDWGQDVLKLRRYMRANRLPSIALQYFGSADLAYYGVTFDPLESALHSQSRRPVAISVTELEMDPQFALLRRCDPIERVGYSIYIFDWNSPGCPGRQR